MTPARAYLDWNAAAPLLPEARQAVLRALDLCGNPSAVHGEGRAARRLVEEAREDVARLVGARPDEIVFTSGATEANNLALAGPADHAVVSQIEHASVLAPARRAGRRLTVLGCDTNGMVSLSGLSGFSASDWGSSAIVSVSLATSETGVLQPVGRVADALPGGVRFHCDATQAVGRIPVSLAALGRVDYCTFSAHKLGGPKGAGALVVRRGAPVTPLILGGGQERRQRAGTENVPAIAGFGAACRAALTRLAAWERTRVKRDALETAIVGICPEAVILGHAAPRLPNTTCVAVPDRSAETLVAAFDLAGVAVSAGSACSSGKVGPSAVLAAMSVPPALARGAIRISIGPETSDGEIAAFLSAFEAIKGRAAVAA